MCLEAKRQEPNLARLPGSLDRCGRYQFGLITTSPLTALNIQIISLQANKPVVGIVQDTLCGIRKFTLHDCPKPLWTGKQILSLAIPSGINIVRKSEPPAPNPVADDGMLVKNGEILYGIVAKPVVRSAQGGLVHVVFREKGPEAFCTLFSGLQMIVNYWLFHNGFSIGIGDTIVETTMDHISNRIATTKAKVYKFIEQGRRDGIKPKPGMMIRESLESEVNAELNKARDNTGRHAEKSSKNDNNVKQMVIAGSKGSFINISQTSACAGQQSVEGKRIPFGFKHRTLPHFAKDDYSPEARGFVENSYLRGLTPQEFFFHAMAGREGLIDTAVKTAETGYIQRRLVKALEDVSVCYDGAARNSLGDILQFVYGEDGMDGAYIEQQQIDSYYMSDRAFYDKFRVDVIGAEDENAGFREGALQVGLDVNNPDLQRELDTEWDQLNEDRRLLRTFIFQSPPSRMCLPVNLRRIIQNAQQIFHDIDRRKPSNLDPLHVLRDVRASLPSFEAPTQSAWRCS